jgi:hypothetical protein
MAKPVPEQAEPADQVQTVLNPSLGVQVRQRDPNVGEFGVQLPQPCHLIGPDDLGFCLSGKCKVVGRVSSKVGGECGGGAAAGAG